MADVGQAYMDETAGRSRGLDEPSSAMGKVPVGTVLEGGSDSLLQVVQLGSTAVLTG